MGYPSSVSPDYLSFQLYDTLQGLSSYIRGMSTAHAILTAMRVGTESTTALSALYSFFIRDLTGHLASLTFTSLYAGGLDAEAKQWRLFADLANDLGLTLELIAPAFPRHVVAFTCVASVFRALTGVAGGATRAALTAHFALAGNTADLSAKEGSQETLVTLVGMVLGMASTRLLAGHTAATWLTFLALTLLHVRWNMRAMRALAITSLNGPRAELLFDTYLHSGRVLTPAQVAPLEPLTIAPLRSLRAALGLGPPAIRYGGPPVVAGKGTGKRSAHVLSPGRDARHAICCMRGGRSLGVILHREAEGRDCLRAALHAVWMRARGAPRPDDSESERHLRTWVQTTWAEAGDAWERLEEGLRMAGWNVDRVTMAGAEARAEWDVPAAGGRGARMASPGAASPIPRGRTPAAGSRPGAVRRSRSRKKDR